MIAPASGQLVAKFGIRDEVLSAMITSIFVLGKRRHPAPSLPSAIARLSRPRQLAPLFSADADTHPSLAAYAIGPLFLGPASELWGRVKVLQLANLVYLVFNFVCAFAPNTGAMLAFRFLSGLGGSAPLAIGAGVLGDLWRAEERGKAASLYSLGPLLGPAVGPIAGGWIAQRLPDNGYRWVFFSTTIVRRCAPPSCLSGSR